MLRRTLWTTALLMGALTTIPVLAQEQVPASLGAFKPHEVVEAFTAEAKSIGLTQEQLTRLGSLHVAVRDERHRWVSGPGNKVHQTIKMKPMISREQAYAQALSILTPAQQDAVVKRFNAPNYVPMVPSLASKVPASLKALKPHEIVQVFSAEATNLDLTEDQVHDLQALHVAVRDEPHSYTSRTPAGKAHRYVMMEPMISQRRAYNDALSFLTAGQREQAYKLFSASGYKPSALGKVSDK